MVATISGEWLKDFIPENFHSSRSISNVHQEYELMHCGLLPNSFGEHCLSAIIILNF